MYFLDYSLLPIACCLPNRILNFHIAHFAGEQDGNTSTGNRHAGALRRRHRPFDHVGENFGQCQDAYPRHPRRRAGWRFHGCRRDRIGLLQAARRCQESSIWGTQAKASVSTAAFANGLLAHALDYDDWEPSSMSVIRQQHDRRRGAQPLAEHIGASGKELLKAYVLGIEVILQDRRQAPNLQDRGFHSTPVFGSLGATVACASLLETARRQNQSRFRRRRLRLRRHPSPARLDGQTVPRRQLSAQRRRSRIACRAKASPPTPPSSRRRAAFATLFSARTPATTIR